MSGADRSSRAGRSNDRRAENRKEMIMFTVMTEMREIDRDEMAGVDGGHTPGDFGTPGSWLWTYSMWQIHVNGPVP
jgi:hypothetical protein